MIDGKREKSNQLVALFQHPFSSVSDMAVDTQGNVYLCGFTSDPSFPVTEGAYDTTFTGEKDAYVMKLRADLQTIEWSTFLGGSDVDQAYSIAVDSTGCPYVAGFTDSTDFLFLLVTSFP